MDHTDVGLRAAIRALNDVVANWDTPPPTDSTCSPFSMAPATTKPFSMVRSPTTSLIENWPPLGGMT